MEDHNWIGSKLPRDNNLDVIRLLAALNVAFVHAATHLQMPIPDAARTFLLAMPRVDEFFFISGLLVTASYSRRNVRTYAWSRFKRIYPALFLAFILAFTILAAFGQIALNGTLALWVFTQITVFQVFNPTMFRDFGVGVINGSLWTIPVEIGFYCILPIVVWTAARFTPKKQALTALMIASAALSFAVEVYTLTNPGTMVSKALDVTPAAHWWVFACGALSYMYFDAVMTVVHKMPLPLWFAAYCIVAFAIAPHLPLAVAHLATKLILFVVVLSFGIAVGSIANILGGVDISYGLYLYHMPIVNMVLALGIVGAIGVCGALALAVAFALCSWVFLESRILGRAATAAHPLSPSEVAP